MSRQDFCAGAVAVVAAAGAAGTGVCESVCGSGRDSTRRRRTSQNYSQPAHSRCFHPLNQHTLLTLVFGVILA